MNQSIICLLACLLAAPVFGAAAQDEHGGWTIYHHVFDGSSSTNIHDTAPDTAPDGVKFVAHTAFKADGSHTALGNGSGWFLPFTPEEGRTYYLMFDLGARSGGVAGYGYFIGFCEDVPTAPVGTGSENKLQADPTTVKAAHFLQTVGNNQTLLGTAGGQTGLQDWDELASTDNVIQIMIVLENINNTPIASYYARTSSGNTWIEVETSGERTLNASDIGAIGFGMLGSTVDMTCEEFKLWYKIDPR